MMLDVEFVWLDVRDQEQTEGYLVLLNDYIADPMGGGELHHKSDAERLARGVIEHGGRVLLLKQQGRFVGFATIFVNFSTFKLKPYWNLHDFAVSSAARGRGLGRGMFEFLIDSAKKAGCCKITLEVREDNKAGKSLYQSLGFSECEPSRMHFWNKLL